MRLEDLGLIGNCQFSALVENSGEIVWCCLPRFDSEPIFSTLLDSQDGGRYRIGPAGGESGSQRYLANTNILETTFTTPTGSFKVIDFAPRFMQFSRAFRPTQLPAFVVVAFVPFRYSPDDTLLRSKTFEERDARRRM